RAVPRREKFSAATTRLVWPVSRHRGISRSIAAASPENSAGKADCTRAGKRTDDAQVAPARWQISLKSETPPAKSASLYRRINLRSAKRPEWHRACFQPSRSSRATFNAQRSNDKSHNGPSSRAKVEGSRRNYF